MSHVLGAILTPASLSVARTVQAPNSFLRESMYWQISGTGAQAPPRQTSRRAVQERVGSSQPSDLFLKLLDPLCLVSGGSRPQTAVDLGLPDPGAQSLGVDAQLLGNPADRAPGPRRVSQRVQRPSSGPQGVGKVGLGGGLGE